MSCWCNRSMIRQHSIIFSEDRCVHISIWCILCPPLWEEALPVKIWTGLSLNLPHSSKISKVNLLFVLSVYWCCVGAKSFICCYNETVAEKLSYSWSYVLSSGIMGLWVYFVVILIHCLHKNGTKYDNYYSIFRILWSHWTKNAF